ncbi:hypothetical protein K438DRAFT_1786647 [Mycena galopus ATCC 62051]|nr:hypothetical protein K438DRAFT_1786647 [Mycena galopus ATCC 62051]
MERTQLTDRTAAGVKQALPPSLFTFTPLRAHWGRSSAPPRATHPPRRAQSAHRTLRAKPSSLRRRRSFPNAETARDSTGPNLLSSSRKPWTIRAHSVRRAIGKFQATRAFKARPKALEDTTQGGEGDVLNIIQHQRACTPPSLFFVQSVTESQSDSEEVNPGGDSTGGGKADSES